MTVRTAQMLIAPQARAGAPAGREEELRRFWTVRNLVPAGTGQARAEIDIYGIIGVDTDDWTGDTVGISAQTFLDEVRNLGPAAAAGGELTLRINSPGGNAFDGSAIYGVLSQLPCHKVGIVDGLAASAASVILMGCDEIRMPANAMIMIHDPWTIACGNSADMRTCADQMDSLKNALLSCYAAKNTKMSSDEIAAAMSAETYYTAAEALEAGFCDTVLEPVRAQNLASVDVKAMRRVPQALAQAVEAAQAQVAAEEAEAARVAEEARVAAEAEQARLAEEEAARAAAAAVPTALASLQSTVASLAETVAALAQRVAAPADETGGAPAAVEEPATPAPVPAARSAADEAALARIRAFAEGQGGEVLATFARYEGGPIEALRTAVYGKAAALDAAPIQPGRPGTAPKASAAAPATEIGRAQVESYYDTLNRR